MLSVSEASPNPPERHSVTIVFEYRCLTTGAVVIINTVEEFRRVVQVNDHQQADSLWCKLCGNFHYLDEFQDF